MRRNKILNVNNSIYLNRRVKVILLGSCRILKEAGPITQVLKVRKDWLFNSGSASGLLDFKHFQIVIQDCNWAKTVLKFAIRKTQTHSKHTLKEIISLEYSEVRMLNVELHVGCFFFFSHYNCGLCFNIENIVFKLTIRNYDTPSKWVIQKRIKNEVIPKDFLSFRIGVIIIVNYKYQGNILLGPLNLSLGKRKWWFFFFSIIIRCIMWTLRR